MTADEYHLKPIKHAKPVHRRNLVDTLMHRHAHHYPAHLGHMRQFAREALADGLSVEATEKIFAEAERLGVQIRFDDGQGHRNGLPRFSMDGYRVGPYLRGVQPETRLAVEEVGFSHQWDSERKSADARAVKKVDEIVYATFLEGEHDRFPARVREQVMALYPKQGEALLAANDRFAHDLKKLEKPSAVQAQQQARVAVTDVASSIAYVGNPTAIMDAHYKQLAEKAARKQQRHHG